MSRLSKSLHIAVLVSGRGSNLQAIIDAARTQKINSKIDLVISNQPNAPGLEKAQKAGIATLVIASKNKPNAFFQSELLTALKKQNPDLIVLAGFMKILSREVVSAFRGKIINIHPSLLPDFPGLNAQQQALDAGAKTTGCTVHFVDEGCDTGPIILQKIENILPDDDFESLDERLLKKCHGAMIEAIKLIEENKVNLQNNKILIRK